MRGAAWSRCAQRVAERAAAGARWRRRMRVAGARRAATAGVGVAASRPVTATRAAAPVSPRRLGVAAFSAWRRRRRRHRRDGDAVGGEDAASARSRRWERRRRRRRARAASRGVGSARRHRRVAARRPTAAARWSRRRNARARRRGAARPKSTTMISGKSGSPRRETRRPTDGAAADLSGSSALR